MIEDKKKMTPPSRAGCSRWGRSRPQTPASGGVLALACAALLLGPARALAAPAGEPPKAAALREAGPPAAPAAAPPAAPPAAAAAVPADAPPPTAEERAAIKKKAAAAYKRGRDLIQTKGACDARGGVADTTEALDAFLDSLRLVPKPGTTFLAAVCHQALDHLEEALDFYDTYLRLPGIPDDLKLEAQKAVVGLRARVGTIVVEETERGAKIVVDGRARGEFPAPTPVVATAGKHLVQVYLAGFAPFEATVGILPGEVTKVSAHLTRLPRLGQVEVKERAGKAVDVILDGTRVGRTPWAGQTGEGEHGVVLRGDDDVGSSPSSVTIAADKPAALTLAVERLDATLRVVPEPSGATVLIDTAFVGRGAFEWRRRPGEHPRKVVADGFVATTQKVTAAPGSDETLHVKLTREPAAPIWQKPAEVGPSVGRSSAGGAPAWAWVLAGTGAAALGAAAGFGADGLVTVHNLDSLCNGNLTTCRVSSAMQASTTDLLNAQKDRDLALTVGFGAAGVVGVAVGLAKALGGPKAQARTEGVVVIPMAGPRLAGAAVGGRF